MFPNYISKLSLFFAQLYFDLKPVKVAQFVLQNSLAKTYLSKFEGHFVSVYEYCVLVQLLIHPVPLLRLDPRECPPCVCLLEDHISHRFTVYILFKAIVYISQRSLCTYSRLCTVYMSTVTKVNVTHIIKFSLNSFKNTHPLYTLYTYNKVNSVQ